MRRNVVAVVGSAGEISASLRQAVESLATEWPPSPTTVGGRASRAEPYDRME